ncbi:MAG: hypothetical protein Q9162_001099 [Coniocarpon cinnabarinum]
MPRTLPWLRNDTNDTASSTSQQNNSERHEQKRREQKDDINFSRPDKRQRGLRSPSTSPPPAPPDVEFMQDGDEQWLMVEDEFLATAQTFTQHMHHAEYQRMKQLNKRKNQDMTESIKRPTCGDISTDRASTRAISMCTKKAKIDKAVQAELGRSQVPEDLQHEDASEASEGREELLIDDRNLAGLMYGTENRGVRYDVRFAQESSPRSKTRAAAGLTSNARLATSDETKTGALRPQDVESHSTPDTTGVMMDRTKATKIETSKRPSSPAHSSRHETTNGAATESRMQAPFDNDLVERLGYAHKGSANIFTNNPSAAKSNIFQAPSGQDEIVPTNTRTGVSLKDRMRARRQQRQDREQSQGVHEESHKTQDDEIPMWLV